MNQNKKEIMLTMSIVKVFFGEIEKEIEESIKDKTNEDTNISYNTELIRRNRIIINRKLKELERY